MAEYYSWIKAVHIMAVIAWMAGLFYLPRLFVYHVESVGSSGPTHEMFQTMERRLLKAIMNPAMIATWLFGGAMIGIPGVIDWSQGWPWIKAAAVLAMTGFHMWLGIERKRLAAGTCTVSGRGFRLMNEVPTVLMIVIVIMVIVRPV